MSRDEEHPIEGIVSRWAGKGVRHDAALYLAAYAANGNLVEAQARLNLLGDQDMARTLALQAQHSLAENRPELEARPLGLLAVALGQAKGEEEKQEQRYHLRERWSGSFTRSITLPTRIKAEDIQATCENGTLTLHLPKTEEVKPKRISVRSEGGQKLIEGKVKDQKK